MNRVNRVLELVMVFSLYAVIPGSALVVLFTAYRHIAGFFNGSCP